MCRIRSIFYVAAAAAVFAGGFAPAALAGRNDCNKPPPAWYTAPRYTHSYSQEWGAGYSRATHDYSARRYTAQVRYYVPQRRYYTTHARYERDPFRRW
jgi:hypothetical protein